MQTVYNFSNTLGKQPSMFFSRSEHNLQSLSNASTILDKVYIYYFIIILAYLTGVALAGDNNLK